MHEIVEIKAKNLEPSYLNYRVGGMRLQPLKFKAILMHWFLGEKEETY